MSQATLFTILETAKYPPIQEAGISDYMLRKMVKEGKLRSVRLSKMPRIPKASLDALVEDLSRPTAA